jgi:hypothetical protein
MPVRRLGPADKFFPKKRLSFESKLNNKPQIASVAQRFAGQGR